MSGGRCVFWSGRIAEHYILQKWSITILLLDILLLLDQTESCSHLLHKPKVIARVMSEGRLTAGFMEVFNWQLYQLDRFFFLFIICYFLHKLCSQQVSSQPETLNHLLSYVRLMIPEHQVWCVYIIYISPESFSQINYSWHSKSTIIILFWVIK